MNILTCVSRLTGFDHDDGKFESYGSKTCGWVYGCDACQDACPFNIGALSRERDFPGLAELGAEISPEKIIEMDYRYLREVISPKFYVEPNNVWKWKRNAISAMMNNYEERYKKTIAAALGDADARVRAAAKKALESMGPSYN
jgi:epoxyqueuosine reductase